MSTPDKRTASCLCGKVKLEITGAPMFVNNCHCIPCQKSRAAVFATNAVYKEDQVKYIVSEPSVLKTYEDTTPESGNVLLRSFCGNCGSGVKTSRRNGPGIAAVGLGIIDGDRTGLKPTKELFCVSKFSWVVPLEGAAAFPKMPPSGFESLQSSQGR